MKIIITGATGFIGKALCENLKSNYEVVALSRNTEKAKRLLGNSIKIAWWDGEKTGRWTSEFEGAFCVVNLAGENLGTFRWTKRKKQMIRHSRFASTAAVVNAIKQADKKPQVLVQASAMGWYGSRGETEADEDSGPGEGFLAELCKQWERLISPAADSGVKCVILRTGAVLGKNEGLLSKLVLPFKFYLGGHIGSGQQWVSWIAIDDVVRAINFLINNDSCRGAFNLTGPKPVQLKEFCKTLGRVINKPSWTVLPAFAAKMMFGRMAEELFLASYRIRPKRLFEAGFEFEYPELEEAFTHILKD